MIAAVHAGRRGAAGGIALRALEQMVVLGRVGRADRGACWVRRSAARCYEVPAAMRDEVEAALPGSASTTDRGTPGLDLRAGLAAQLRAAGVAEVDRRPAMHLHRSGPVQPSARARRPAGSPG